MINLETKLREATINFKKFEWEHAAAFYLLTEDFIREFKDIFSKYGCWLTLFTNQTLSEKIIEEFRDEVDWTVISAHQKLSVPFVLRHRNEVNWNNIFRYQDYDNVTREMLSQISNVKIVPREEKMWEKI